MACQFLKVDLVQRIGGSLAWACLWLFWKGEKTFKAPKNVSFWVGFLELNFHGRYGSAKGARWGEQFVQPFVDRRVTERFRELLMTGNAQLQVASIIDDG